MLDNSQDEQTRRRHSWQKNQVLRAWQDHEHAERKPSKSERKPRKMEKLDGTQVALLIAAVLVVGWTVTASALLIVFWNRYNSFIVDETREFYVASGCAAWAKAEAAGELVAALRTRDSLDAAIRLGVYREPTDFRNLERAFAPIMLSWPSVHSVELAFSDRSAAIVVRRRKTSDGEWEVFVQSNADDCFSLGLNGCVDVGTTPGARPWWFMEGYTMIRGEAGGRATSEVDEGGAFKWLGPEILAQPMEDGTEVFFPTVSLLFRTVFPDSGIGTGIVAVGRIVLTLGVLSGDRLQDKRLKDDGKVYLCHVTGAVLASPVAEEILYLEAQGSPARFRHAWELQAAPAAPQLKATFSNFSSDDEPVHETQLADGTDLVVVSPLSHPFGSFVVVTAVLSWNKFGNSKVLMISTMSIALAIVPYAVVVVSICGMCGKQSFEITARGYTAHSRGDHGENITVCRGLRGCVLRCLRSCGQLCRLLPSKSRPRRSGQA